MTSAQFYERPTYFFFVAPTFLSDTAIPVVSINAPGTGRGASVSGNAFSCPTPIILRLSLQSAAVILNRNTIILRLGLLSGLPGSRSGGRELTGCWAASTLPSTMQTGLLSAGNALLIAGSWKRMLAR